MLHRSGRTLAGVLLGLLAAGLLLLLTSSPRGDPISLAPPPTPQPIRVHVVGAVRQEGVYPMPAGSIVAEAIQGAGGALPNADLASINLAAPLVDGQQVFVPLSDLGGSLAGGEAVSAADLALQPVHINTADAEELSRLPGIGPVLAEKILEYRRTHGPFARPEDLLNVSGIGPATLEAIRDWIRVP